MAMKRMHTNSNYYSVAAQAIIPSVARSKQGSRGQGGAGRRWRLNFVHHRRASQIALLISITREVHHTCSSPRYYGPDLQRHVRL